MLKRYIRLISILLLLSMLFAACGEVKENLPSDNKEETPGTETPENPDPDPTPGTKPTEGHISLVSDDITVKVGESGKIQATVVPTNEGDDTTIHYSTPSSCIVLMQDGTFEAVKEGFATVTLTTPAGLTATVAITITRKTEPEPDPEPDDSPDRISTEGGGYGDILRLKSTKELMFTPQINEMRDLVDIGENLSDYEVRLLFILLDENNNEYYAYPEIVTELTASKVGSSYFDIFLQSEDIDCGFCPTAGRVYTIELSIYKEDALVMFGTWQSLKASDSYTESPYYSPSAIPSEEDRNDVECTIEYAIQGTGGTLLGPSKQTLKLGEIAQSIKAVAEKGYMFGGWSDGYPYEERTGDSFIRDKVIYAKFTKIELDPGVPNMYIQTETGAFITSKTEYQNATIIIAGAAQEKYNITVTTQIRGRGNSSFSGSAGINDYGSKNSYRLKLDEKANLLGVGGSANRDWVLNSNKHDASNLRNYAIWNLAEQMQTMPFVPGCTWVNLYINGDYRGVYMLTDHVEAANDRVEVDDSLQEPDKGFLVELDFRGANEDGVVEGLNYFYIKGFYDPTSSISNPREWVIKSDVYSTEETEFIQNYIQACHNAIMSGDRAAIDELVDIPSLMDMLIMEELSKDVDAGGASMYMQKDKGGKLYFTAPWDFDFGFGTYGPATSIRSFVCESGDGHLWFRALLKQDWFLKELQARMVEVTDMITTMQKALRMVGEVLEPAADRNDERWNIYGNNYHQYVSSQVSGRLYSYDEHIEFLCDWIESRWEWMLDEINSRVAN